MANAGSHAPSPVPPDAPHASRTVTAERAMRLRLPPPPAAAAPGWSTRLGYTPLIGLFLALASAAFVGGVVPARQARMALEEEWRGAKARLALLETRVRRADERVAALSAADPPAVREALREVLRYGERGEFVLPDLVFDDR